MIFSASKAYNQLRDTVAVFMERINGNGKIGGPNADGSPKILCIHETHFTKLKNAKGGGHFRVTKGHQTVVMAGVELTGTWKGRKTTGRQFLVIIADKDMPPPGVPRGPCLLSVSPPSMLHLIFGHFQSLRTFGFPPLA